MSVLRWSVPLLVVTAPQCLAAWVLLSRARRGVGYRGVCLEAGVSIIMRGSQSYLPAAFSPNRVRQSLASIAPQDISPFQKGQTFPSGADTYPFDRPTLRGQHLKVNGHPCLALRGQLLGHQKCLHVPRSIAWVWCSMVSRNPFIDKHASTRDEAWVPLPRMSYELQCTRTDGPCLRMLCVFLVLATQTATEVSSDLDEAQAGCIVKIELGEQFVLPRHAIARELP